MKRTLAALPLLALASLPAAADPLGDSFQAQMQAASTQISNVYSFGAAILKDRENLQKIAAEQAIKLTEQEKTIAKMRETCGAPCTAPETPTDQPKEKQP